MVRPCWQALSKLAKTRFAHLDHISCDAQICEVQTKQTRGLQLMTQNKSKIFAGRNGHALSPVELRVRRFLRNFKWRTRAPPTRGWTLWPRRISVSDAQNAQHASDSRNLRSSYRCSHEPSARIWTPNGWSETKISRVSLHRSVLSGWTFNTPTY